MYSCILVFDTSVCLLVSLYSRTFVKTNLEHMLTICFCKITVFFSREHSRENIMWNNNTFISSLKYTKWWRWDSYKTCKMNQLEHVVIWGNLYLPLSLISHITDAKKKSWKIFENSTSHIIFGKFYSRIVLESLIQEQFWKVLFQITF